MKKTIVLLMVLVVALTMSAKTQATPIDTVDVVCYDLQLNMLPTMASTLLLSIS